MYIKEVRPFCAESFSCLGVVRGFLAGVAQPRPLNRVRKKWICPSGVPLTFFGASGWGARGLQHPHLPGLAAQDIILPHHYTFYELIINKARGKSGPLFDFGVKLDIRMQHDATKERDESHAGKVVERHWYEKNKHIFPCSRWEVFDPEKKFETYTLHDADFKMHGARR